MAGRLPVLSYTRLKDLEDPLYICVLDVYNLEVVVVIDKQNQTS